MPVKEITNFIVDGIIQVEVCGSDLTLHIAPASFDLTRQQARDLSKALLSASEILRSKRKHKSTKGEAKHGIDQR